MATVWSLTHGSWGTLGLRDNEAAFIHACNQTWGNHYRIETNHPYYAKQLQERQMLQIEHGGLGGFLIALSLQNLALNPPSLDSTAKSKVLRHLSDVLVENLDQGKPLWLAAMLEGWLILRHLQPGSFAWQLCLVLIKPLKVCYYISTLVLTARPWNFPFVDTPALNTSQCCTSTERVDTLLLNFTKIYWHCDLWQQHQQQQLHSFTSKLRRLIRLPAC